MVDGILIILLSMAAILIMAQYLLFVLAKREKTCCHTPSPEEITAVQSLYEYFYQHPSSEMTCDFPHLAAVAEAAKEYKQLNELYEQGMIDEIDYNLQLEQLLPKVNIEQDF